MFRIFFLWRTPKEDKRQEITRRINKIDEESISFLLLVDPLHISISQLVVHGDGGGLCGGAFVLHLLTHFAGFGN